LDADPNAELTMLKHWRCFQCFCGCFQSFTLLGNVHPENRICLVAVSTLKDLLRHWLAWFLWEPSVSVVTSVVYHLSVPHQILKTKRDSREIVSLL